jgi:hypothetical protein
MSLIPEGINPFPRFGNKYQVLTVESTVDHLEKKQSDSGWSPNIKQGNMHLTQGVPSAKSMFTNINGF